MAVAKDSQILHVETAPTLISAPVQSVVECGADAILTRDYGGDSAGELGGGEYGKAVGSSPAIVDGRGRGAIDPKPWQQEGDWPCPNSRSEIAAQSIPRYSCFNINFSFRGICNRCGTGRPAGNLSAIVGGSGCSRVRGRVHGDAGCRSGRGSGGPPGLFGPNDWNCPMCGNINWAKRTKCNICNTVKPGYNEGGAREGRAGGYKEFDEAEIEETKRRRREMEEDDGEMYDEFGNLKKKFRAKARAGDTDLGTDGMGKAGWSLEELRVAEQSKQKSRDGSCFRYDNDAVADRDGSDYIRNLPSDRRSQRGHESGRDTRRGVDEWNTERSRDFSAKDQERVSGGAWAWERVAVRGRGGKDCLESENNQHGKWLHCRKRLRERDRIID